MAKILAYAILEIGFVLIYASKVVNTRLFETSWTRTNADSAFLRLSVYQLSYGFTFGKASQNRTESNSFGDYCATITLTPCEILVPQEGLEPSTISLQGSHSSQLELLWHIWSRTETRTPST